MGADDSRDEDLMLRYRDGDTAAFDTLYARHRGPLFRYLLRQCGRRSIAEELFQDVWTNVIRASARYEVKAKFSTWLYRIARNRLVDHYRAANPASCTSLDDDDPPALAADSSSEPARRVAAARRAERLMAALAALPAEQREAFMLREEGGLGLDEIAEVTGVGRETAKSRLRYAVARLRRALEEET
ncbi:MAG: RNA polymerase sigma factor [Gammaproteobacteria bacterium]|nr:RNA polymerase sigma factor [Gammaproteobacteria bacterium]